MATSRLRLLAGDVQERRGRLRSALNGDRHGLRSMPDLPRLARRLLEIPLEDVADDATRLVHENDLVLAGLDRLNVGFVHVVVLVEIRPLGVRRPDRVEPRDLVARGPDA